MGISESLAEPLLRKLYVNEKKSIKEVAEILHCSSDTVYRALKKHHMIRHRESLSLPEDELRDLYINRKYTIKRIATLKGCSTTTISMKLREYGIEARHCTVAKEIDEEMVVRAYVSGNTISFLVKSLHISRERIQGILKRHGITERLVREKKKLPMDEIIYMYEKMLLPLGEISSFYDVKATTLARRLKARGYKVRGNCKGISTEEIASYYRRTKSIQETAEHFHCSYSMIRKRLLSAGALA